MTTLTNDFSHNEMELILYNFQAADVRKHFRDAMRPKF